MSPAGRLPPWLKVRLPAGGGYLRVKGLVQEHQLHTVCQEARCPNIGECWGAGTATFMILGDICTRRCGYCAVATGRPQGEDLLEPVRLARTVTTLGLDYAVITSVNRDDLPDGGAAVFARCIEAIRHLRPQCQVEVLIPDFRGDWDALATVVRARPLVLNHNIETVPRIFRRVRPKGRYQRSLDLLDRVRALAPDMVTKSGMMVGLGETKEEILQTMRDLRAVGCQILTIGQYLRPSPKHVPVERFYPPQEFQELAAAGRAMGFRHVEAGPLVRSSYRAARHVAGGPVGLGGRSNGEL